MKIGTIDIPQTSALAPMASVADLAYRMMAKRYGAALITGEMCSAKGLCYGDRKSAELLSVSDGERPMAVQLFGDDPVTMAEAAKKAETYRPDFIDINMGCPVPKVAGNGSGSALMKSPRLAAQIVEAVVSAVQIPVTVKIRSGWDSGSINAPEFAALMERSGASALTVHARTRTQMYKGRADWDIIKAVKTSVSIPVIGNGDIDSGRAAADMYRQTGCDLVAVARSSRGRPWIFANITHYLKTGIEPPEPCLAERMEVMLEHIGLICSHKGERLGMREARKHAAWYIAGIKGAASYRNECGKLESYEDVRGLAEYIKTPR
ncbi:MAG: tRNA dihydrouridine synthase DusB [Oscillospiraceae bacterium]|nr:tRNA dihydrouridine synthase DusB [Oscillospiraceae bacterium]